MTRMRKPCRVLLWVPATLLLLSPLPSPAGGEEPPKAEEKTEPAAAPEAAAETKSEVAPAAAKPATSPSEDYRATKLIPRRLLRALLGCWQLDGQERWTISRLDTNGAQVVTKPVRSSKKRAERVPFPELAKRAAVPATLMFDAKQDNFGFSTADRGRTSLVVFKISGPILEASLFSKRGKKGTYAFSGYSATLDRCKTPAHAARGTRPAPVPPRLK